MTFVGLLAVCCGTAWQRASACFEVALPPYEIDETLRAVDSTPPTPFSDVSALGVRIAATHCVDDLCTDTSCGDWGGLRITFTPPRDDRTPDAELGYRVIWTGSTPPEAMREAMDHVWPLGDTSQVSIEVGFDQVSTLDGAISLVAVDRAGNESAPSSPVRVAVHPCTSYFDEPLCEESGCSVLELAGGARPVGTGPWIAPLMAAGAWFGIRRMRGRR